MKRNTSKTHKIREQLTVKQEFNLILYLMLELIEKCNLTPLRLYPCQINLHYQFYYNENYLHFHLHMNWGIHTHTNLLLTNRNQHCWGHTNILSGVKGSKYTIWTDNVLLILSIWTMIILIKKY